MVFSQWNKAQKTSLFEKKKEERKRSLIISRNIYFPILYGPYLSICFFLKKKKKKAQS
jgi:hypothetical protein